MYVAIAAAEYRGEETERTGLCLVHSRPMLSTDLTKSLLLPVVLGATAHVAPVAQPFPPISMSFRQSDQGIGLT